MIVICNDLWLSYGDMYYVLNMGLQEDIFIQCRFLPDIRT